MRTSLFLMLVAFLHISSDAASQGVTIAVKKASLKSVFREISKQTGIYVLYDESMLVNTIPVTINVQHAKLEQVMTLCLKDQPLSYTIEDNFIIIRPKKKEHNSPGPKGILMMLPGLVTDTEGTPLPGVTVALGGTGQGTLTGEDGRFLLREVPPNAVVVISSVGYIKQEIITGELPETRNIVLKRQIASLDEMQVIGYGTTTKRYTTGDVSSVSATEIQNHPVENILTSIADKVPGLLITQGTGITGGEYSVQIRGLNSISNGNAPLYVIDGVPFTATNPYVSFGESNVSPIWSAAGFSNPLNMINPAEIERIDVLKDADVTAIYGSRGANGVILITTKKGTAGKTKVSFNLYTGVGKNAEKPSLMNTSQYLAMRREALKNDGAAPGPQDYDLNGTWGDTTRYTDWADLLIHGTAKIWDGQLSVSGGNANTHFFIGGGYHKESTVFPGNAANQRVSGHINLDHTSGNKKFKTILSVGLTVAKSDLPHANPYGYINIAPNMPELINADGSLNWPAGININPFSQLQTQFLSNTNNLITHLTVSYQLAKPLKISANMGYTTMWDNTSILSPLTSINPVYQQTSGSSYFGNSSIRTWIAEPQATYEQPIGRGKFSALIGSTFQQNINEATGLYATGFSADNQLANISAARSISPFKANYAQYRYQGVFARVNYSLDEQYLFNITGRRDGSSRFGPGQQFADFWAAGAAWIFSKQPVIATALPFLSFGKLHTSYGLTGNDQIGDYRYLSLYQPSRDGYQGIIGMYPNNLMNPDYGWETNKKLELGLLLGVLNDRILFTANWYQHRSANQLLPMALPPTAGFPSIQSNLPALVQNKGWEFQLNTINIQRKAFSWNTSFNISVNRNKLLKYPGLETSTDAGKYAIGRPLSIKKLFYSRGVDPVTGVYQFIDRNGKPTVTPNTPYDLTNDVNLVPEWFGGLQSNITCKSWRLDMSWQVRKQMGRNPMYNGYYATPGFFGLNQPVAVLDRWKEKGDMVPYQQYSHTYGYPGANSRQYAAVSNLAYTDASFIRLKNLSLAWEVPQKWLTGVHLENGKIYMQAQNLLTITGYNEIDPETQGEALPPLKVITVGIQCTL